MLLASGGEEFLEKFRTNQQAIKLANLKEVDAKGLELSGDKLHLWTAGEVKLGQMLADAFLQF